MSTLGPDLLYHPSLLPPLGLASALLLVISLCLLLLKQRLGWGEAPVKAVVNGEAVKGLEGRGEVKNDVSKPRALLIYGTQVCRLTYACFSSTHHKPCSACGSLFTQFLAELQARTLIEVSLPSALTHERAPVACITCSDSLQFLHTLFALASCLDPAASLQLEVLT